MISNRGSLPGSEGPSLQHGEFRKVSIKVSPSHHSSAARHDKNMDAKCVCNQASAVYVRLASKRIQYENVTNLNK